MSVFCSIHGLSVRFNVALAALAGLPSPGGSAIDVDFTLGSLPMHSGSLEEARARRPYVSTLETDTGHVELFVTRLPGSGDFRMDYDNGTVVVVEASGRQVWAAWPDSITADDVAVYLLGPVLGVVLRLRGILCLHASAVVIDGRAVAFVGVSGAGKSTTAAAFARAGYAVLSDDLVPIRDRGNRFEVAASRPRLRLWPDSAAALYGDASMLPRSSPALDKRVVDLSGAASVAATAQLDALYFLSRREQTFAVPKFEEMEARAAVIAMIADSFASKYQDKTTRAREFDLACRMAGALHIRRVTAPANLATLPALCAAVVTDLQQLRHPALA